MNPRVQRPVSSAWFVILLGVGCGKPSPSPDPAASHSSNPTHFTAGESKSSSANPQNPFGIKLEPIPVDDAVREFAGTVKLSGADDDPNAANWATEKARTKGESILGEWNGRWRFAAEGAPWVVELEPSKLQKVGDRFYFLFTYHEGRYLMSLETSGNDQLIGRYMSERDPRDTGFFVGKVVSPNRIDGVWSGPAGNGRWDFRRKDL